MYLSTLFLSELKNGAEHAITKCNEEFLMRSETIQDFFFSFSGEQMFQFSRQCDEIMALWDVFREFEEEIRINLPIINVMNTICAARRQCRGC